MDSPWNLDYTNRRLIISSDQHFLHRKIQKYDGRPFDVEEQTDILVDNWNKVVHPDDYPIINGDFSFGPPIIRQQIRKRMNGNIILVKGNHDLSHRKSVDYLGFHMSINHALVEIPGMKLYIRHYPQYDPNKWYGADAHLCGHVHTLFVYHPAGILNVGVAKWNNYSPIIIEPR